MTTTRRFVATYLALMIAAVTLYFLSPSIRWLAVSIIGVGSAGAIVAGLRRYRPPAVGPWWMLGAALLLNATARLVYNALPGPVGALKPWAWTVLTMHLVMAVLLIGGIVGMAKGAIRGVAGAIDAAIIALGTGLVATILIAIPYSRLPGTGILHGSVRTAYVLRDVLILAAALLLVTAVRRSTSVLLLFVGLLGLLSYDLAFRIGRLQGKYLAGTAIDVGWLVFFVAIGGAALVPSMVAAGASRGSGDPEVKPLRLVPVAVAALLPTILLLNEPFGLPPWSHAMIISVASVVLILVFARMTHVAVRLRRQVYGERVLRESIADLADVQDAATVVSAFDRAVRRLLGPGKDYRLVLAPPGPYLPAGAEAREPQPRPTADLPPAVAAQVGDEGFTLALPLTRPSPPGLGRTSVPEPGIDIRGATGHTDWPTLLVRSDRGSLVAIRPRLEVLASEAALALERIRLHETVVQHASEAYFRTVVQNSTDVILIINGDATIRYASPSAETMLGPGNVHGMALPDLVRGEDQARLTELLEHAQTADGTSPTISLQGDWIVPRPGREPARVEASCRDLRHDPTVGGLVVTLRDVTVQRHLEHELIERAFQDPLTGLGNRAAFSDQLEAAVRSAASDNGVIAALFIDLDDMKVINDGLGHDAGDALLTRTGERLRRFVADRAATQPGMAARLGGDEFAVLLDGLTDQRAAEDAATQLVAELSQPVHLSGTDVTCTASVGIATTAEHVYSSAELLRHADLALYAAKAAGKGQSTRYQPWMRNAVMERLELRSALENAIANDALFLEYQPIVALDSLVPVGFEALLRWQHPARGRLAPDTFISVAEESGLITPIGEWVLTTALSTLNLLTPGGQNGRPYIAVNVSARQFKDGDFVDSVRRVLSESGVPPELLLLEITESLLLRDDKTTWLDLQRLRRLGIRIAIDDFGTGYSALSYLRQVPLDIVKLDRTFIQHMTVSVQQRELVAGIVNLTRTLGLQVVAEGIETDVELRHARQVGCDYGQGYLFGKPHVGGCRQDWLGRPERSPGLSPQSAGIGPVPDAGAAVAGPSMSVSGTQY